MLFRCGDRTLRPTINIPYRRFCPAALRSFEKATGHLSTPSLAAAPALSRSTGGTALPFQ